MNRIQKIQRIINEVEQNLKSDLNLDKICLECSDYSLSNVNQILKQEINTTLNEYLKNRRFFLACEDLLFSDKLITEISLTYGYSNISSFSRAFKDRVGVSPEVYRKNNKNSFLYPKVDLIDEEEKKKQADKAFKLAKKNGELIHNLLLKLALLYNKNTIEYYETKFTIQLDLDKKLRISTPLQELEITSIIVMSNYVKNEILSLDSYAFFENKERGENFLLLQDSPYFFITRIFLSEFMEQKTLDKDIVRSYFTVDIFEETECEELTLCINEENKLDKIVYPIYKEVLGFINHNFIQEVALDSFETNKLIRYVRNDLKNNLGRLNIDCIPKSILEKINKDLDRCILPQIILIILSTSIAGFKSGFSLSLDLYEKLILVFEMDQALISLNQGNVVEISTTMENGLFAYCLHTIRLGIMHDNSLEKIEKKIDHILKQKLMVKLSQNRE